MDNNKKFKYFGYVDLFNSLVEISVSVFTNGMSMYFILEKETYVSIFLTFFWPALNLILTVGLIATNVAQMKNMGKLIQAGKENAGGSEMEEMKGNWTRRNIVTCFVAFIWFPCFGIVTFYQHGWYMSLILGVFLMEILSRGVVTCGIYKIKIVEELEYPSLPPDLMDDFVEMQQQRRQQQEAPMCESGWV